MATTPTSGSWRFRGELATEQRGSKELNVCPWSKLEGAGHCAWRDGKHLRPSHLHSKDLLDHLARDHGSHPAQGEQALAMMNGVVPRGLAGPFAAAQAGSKALALPAGAHHTGAHGASPSATSSGARGSAAVSSTGSTGARASGGGTMRSSTVSRATHRATSPSMGGRRGSASGLANGSSRPLARAVPPLLVTWTRRGTQIRRRSPEGTPPLTPGRQCPGMSRARCEGTACPWPRVCSTVRR